MRFLPFAGATLPAAAVAAIVALGACATTTSTTAGTTPTADPNAPGGASANTGVAVPVTAHDTTHLPPSGAANSVTGVGTGSASLGTGIAPGSGEANTMSAGGVGSMASLGGDAHIVSLIDVINTGEIAAGMLARERATLPQIRAFANQMVQEHTELQTQDRTLARNPVYVAGDSAQITRTMMQQSHDARAKLQQAPAGAAFDAMYIAGEIQDHQQALNALNAAQTQARDGAVANLVKGAIPRVQAHLAEAQRISATMTAQH